jgi:hypothetical protein
MRCRLGLTYIACHDNVHAVDPRFMSQMKSHDVASIICQALLCLPRHPPHCRPSFIESKESHDVASIICQTLGLGAGCRRASRRAGCLRSGLLQARRRCRRRYRRRRRPAEL